MNKFLSQQSIPRLMIFGIALFFFLTAQRVDAATLRLSPDTGVYTAGSTFTATVLINTQAKPINAADGKLSFNPRELKIVNLTRANSIFGLWTEEPSFSNELGTINFGGGSPSGYTGTSGNILTVTFQALNAGTPKIQFKSGSVLAADGLGTNVLNSMTGSTYTVVAQSTAPEQEYLAPANTPLAPVIHSESHPDSTAWYKQTTAVLTWDVPRGIVAVRTLLNQEKTTVPNIVYDEPIASRTIESLPQGESYFHIQFKNAEGWGKITHYRLGVDTESPDAFTIQEKSPDVLRPGVRVLEFLLKDISPVQRYLTQIDGGEPLEYADKNESHEYVLPILPPGHHSIVVEAFDSAGNSKIASFSFDVQAFEAPRFTEFPLRLNTDVIPAIKGQTQPKSEVAITVKDTNGVAKVSHIKSDDNGVFIFIPDTSFEVGVYDLVAIATNQYGSVSEASEAIRIIVETPGYIRIGTRMVSFLSVLVPLIALLLVFLFGIWYLWHRLVVWQRKVKKETYEAEDQLRIELDATITHLHGNISKLRESRKGKLTKEETALIEQIEDDIDHARTRVQKEISDISHVTGGSLQKRTRTEETFFGN